MAFASWFFRRIVAFGSGGDTTPGGAQSVILREDGFAILREDGTFYVREG